MAQKTAWTGAVLTETDINTYLMHEGGAWTSYTPTGTNVTLGNGTIVGGWARAGRLITFWAKFTLGSSSAVGTGPTLSIPVAYAAGNELETFTCMFYDSSATTRYMGVTNPATTTTVAFNALAAGGTYLTYGGVSATIPFTWATGDVIVYAGTYEAAS